MILLINHDFRVRSQWGRYNLRIYIVYPIPWDLLYTWGWLYNMLYPLVNKHNYGKSPFLKGKSTISMAIFNIFLYVYQRVYIPWSPHPQIHQLLSSSPASFARLLLHWFSFFCILRNFLVDMSLVESLGGNSQRNHRPARLKRLQ